MKKVSMKLFSALVALVMVFSFAACGGDKGNGADTGDKVYEWKLQNSYGPGDQTWDIQMPMIVDAIEKATDGRIKITTFQPGAICEPEQAPQSVKEGLLDAAMSTAGDAGAIVPAAYAENGIPFFWETAQDMFDTYYDNGLLEFLRGEYESQNIYYGMPVPNGTYNLMTKFPVTQASDLKGKKIRAVSSWGNFVENLGGSPVVMPGGDIYQGLKLGTIDGTSYTVADLKNAKLSDVVTNVMEQPGSGSGFVSFLINKAKWDELPADLQEAVNNALKDVYAPIMQENIKYDEEARQAAIDGGVKINKISDENMPAFWEAGLKTADQVVSEHPEAKPGMDIIKKWHDAAKG
ncbi:MAG: TRAP transporter substrate-binding protein DctP [Clostridiales Family XIII bacterium]|jgi:TRAP-type C4-dicarboxylate transport system substrate-binding protein|nr:TRAP transporter substrate-binding protein DctP [Clostridiales Family XIII bacterium]